MCVCVCVCVCVGHRTVVFLLLKQIDMEQKHPNVFKNCLRCQVQLGNLEDAKKDMFFLVHVLLPLQ